MSIKKWTVLILSLVLCVFLLVGLNTRENKHESTYVYTVTESTSKEELFERGIVVSDDVEYVRSGASGVFVDIVESGIFVNKGQRLFKMDCSEAEGWYEEAQDRMEQLESDKRKLLRSLSVTQLEERNRKLITESDLALAKLALELEQIGLSKNNKRILAIDRELLELDVTEVEDQLERELRLVDKGLASAQDVDKIRRNLISKQAQLEELKISIRMQEAGASEEELEELKSKVSMQEFLVEKSNSVSESRIKNIKTQIQTIEERLSVERKDMTISGAQIKGGESFSPRDGIAINIGFTDWRNAGRWAPNTIGTQRWMGDVIFEVVDPSKMRIETLISELDLSLVEQGQVVEIFLPALKNKKYTGVLSYIGGIGMDRNDASRLRDDMGKTGITVYNVSVSFDHADNTMRPGMSATIRFPATRTTTTLLVPISYARKGEDGSFSVLKLNGQTREETQITAIYQGSQYLSITSGLSSGDQIVAWSSNE